MRHGGLGEAEDCCDLIEWLAAQPWTNWQVGMTGVSYLAAINPWERFSDWYREFALHGGIPETSFLVRGCANLQWSSTRTEDTVANARAHPLYDAYWESKECEFSAIRAPAYVVASWSDHGLHTRGTLEAYKQLGSRERWLEVHGRKKWQYYYRPESIVKQRQFFDHFLKNRPTPLTSWPRVLIEILEGVNAGGFRGEREWQLADTVFRRLFLDARDARLHDTVSDVPAAVGYDPTAPDGRVVFDYRFDEGAELTGHMKLRLWVQAVDADDMDLFVGIEKWDVTAAATVFTGASQRRSALTNRLRLGLKFSAAPVEPGTA